MEKTLLSLAESTTTADIMLVQEALQDAGLYQGDIDGQAGAKTKIALRQYKKANHLPVNNSIDAALVQRLRDAFY